MQLLQCLPIGQIGFQEAQGCTAEDVSEDGDALSRAQLRPAVEQLFEHAHRGLPLRMRPALHRGAVWLRITANFFRHVPYGKLYCILGTSGAIMKKKQKARTCSLRATPCLRLTGFHRCAAGPRRAPRAAPQASPRPPAAPSCRSAGAAPVWQSPSRPAREPVRSPPSWSGAAGKLWACLRRAEAVPTVAGTPAAPAPGAAGSLAPAPPPHPCVDLCVCPPGSARPVAKVSRNGPSGCRPSASGPSAAPLPASGAARTARPQGGCAGSRIAYKYMQIHGCKA